MSELAEGARLEIVCTSQAYRGFESHSLRHKKSRLNLRLFLWRREWDNVPVRFSAKGALVCASRKPDELT